jgi:hypothetical protein
LLPAGDHPLIFLSVHEQFLFSGGDHDKQLYLMEDGFIAPSLKIQLPDGPKASIVVN